VPNMSARVEMRGREGEGTTLVRRCHCKEGFFSDSERSVGGGLSLAHRPEVLHEDEGIRVADLSEED
jgi:hypothetical protein